MSEWEELLPCPFCGSADVHNRGGEGIICFGCDAQVLGAGNTSDVDTWNRRTPAPSGEWRPIGTAPHTGRILLYWPDGGIEVSEDPEWYINVDDGPTHWQPCPAAPQPHGEGET